MHLGPKIEYNLTESVEDKIKIVRTIEKIIPSKLKGILDDG